jgi:hypothetical protein
MKNQISPRLRLIEIILVQTKPVISYNPASKLVLFQTGAFLPLSQATENVIYQTGISGFFEILKIVINSSNLSFALEISE